MARDQLRQAAQQALEALECTYGYSMKKEEAIAALRAALAEPQSTHSDDCYQWHHQCAIALVQRLRKEQNFCARCGKRTRDIHTCTPPEVHS